MEFNFSDLNEAIAAEIPDRNAIVWRDRRITYQELAERSRKIANTLLEHGFTVRRERTELAGHESGQDHLAIYLHNCNEYLESMIGAFKARAVPLNVNYRYVDEELEYLFANSASRGVVFHSAFAPSIERIRARLGDLQLLIQVPDESGHALIDGAIDYNAMMAGASSATPACEPSPDDLYCLYTGGTTGMPKGVLWRSADAFIACMGGRRGDGTEVESLDAIREHIRNSSPFSTVLGPPLMHGAAQWASFMMMAIGATVVIPSIVEKLDPDDFLSTVERERAMSFSMVGDAFARPILDQLDRKDYDLSSLFAIASGGAPLSPGNKKAFLERIPQVTIYDAIGSSETGAQATNPSRSGSEVTTGDFTPGPGAGVVAADLSRLLSPSENEVGWFAQKGRVPLGYLGDAEKTAKTFPVIEGCRYSVPGDRARYNDNGTIEVLGRDSVTINSGGEKIFAEEVEGALKHHPDVYDTVVAGRPSERWGQEVVAIVQLREGRATREEDLIAEAAKHVARYKLPKRIVFRETIVRSPSGKADYRWAKEQALAAID